MIKRSVQRPPTWGPRSWALLALFAGALVVAAVWLWPREDLAPAATAAPPAGATAPSQAPAPVARGQGGKVSGVVLRGAAPAANVRVTLRSTGVQVVSSLDDGRFLFEDVPAGALYVSAAAKDAVSEVVGPLVLEPGGEVTGVTLRLEGAVSVEGVVIDLLTRRPIPKAVVTTAAETSLTDAQGRFTLRGAKTQTWLDVTAPLHLGRSEWLSLDQTRTGARLEVVLTPSSRLEGTVLEGGKPVAQATVWAEQIQGARRGERTAAVFTDKEGKFLLECGEGLLRLGAATPAGARIRGPDLRLAIGERKEGLVLDAGEVTGVEGAVTRAGTPLAGAQVAVVEAASNDVMATVATGPDGHFRVGSLATGRYLVQVRLADFAAIAGPFDNRGDGTVWQVSLAAGARLSGRVEPQGAGVRVRWRSGDWSGPSAETATDAQGRFSFDGLPGGWVAVDAEGPEGAATVRARAGEEVVLRLAHGPVIVRLSDDSGAQVTDGVLLARSADTGAVRRFIVLAPDGVYRMELPVGVWDLVLEAPGRGRSATARVEVTAAGADVRLSLEIGVTVSGVVRDQATSLPINGARITVSGGWEPNQYRLTMSSDARGEFQVSGAPRSGVLLVEREGYHPTWRRVADGARQDVVLVPQPGAQQASDGQRFEGVGMVLQVVNGRVLVDQVNEGGPAERAGVLRGDVIVAVDGVPAGEPVAAVVNRIRGPAGTPVRVTFERSGQQFDVILRRILLTY